MPKRKCPNCSNELTRTGEQRLTRDEAETQYAMRLNSKARSVLELVFYECEYCNTTWTNHKIKDLFLRGKF